MFVGVYPRLPSDITWLGLVVVAFVVEDADGVAGYSCHDDGTAFAPTACILPAVLPNNVRRPV